jgi:hypothetical protein
MRQLIPGTLAIAALGFVTFGTAPASAQVARAQSALQPVASDSLVQNVQWRGRYYRGPYRGWYGPRYGRYYGWRGRDAAIGAGIASGLIVGGALAAQSRAQADSAVEYCMNRFKSYDPQSGTYLGYDGKRHPCP